MANCRQYIATQGLTVPAQTAFDYHDRRGALNRLVPPWESVTVEKSDGSLEVGSRVILRTSILGVPVRWVAEHTEYQPPTLFCDHQVSGPFAYWQHRHSFETINQNHASFLSQLSDEISYRLPFGFLGNTFGAGKARKTIEAMFAYRHRITHDDLKLYSSYEPTPLRIAISGSNGLVGGALSSMLGLFGHQIHPIIRGEKRLPSEHSPWLDTPDEQTLENMDAVVHLAGKSIASGRWNTSLKAEIRDSRVSKTRQLCELLGSRKNPPKVLVCASATGIYGERGYEILDESSAMGELSQTGCGFLADVGKQWEEACQPAIDAGIRVIHARFGIILSPKGGALQKMLTPAKLLGGSLGSGKQWWSWISLDDAIGAIYHCIQHETLHGPVNLVSPHPTQNRQFVRQLGKALGRPAIFPAPAAGLRIGLGEMADALLLSSARVVPSKLLESNYSFRFTDLSDLFRYSLGLYRKPSEI